MYGISSWVGRSNGLNFVLVGGTAYCNPYIESATAHSDLSVF